jgi:predicted peptidase
MEISCTIFRITISTALRMCLLSQSATLSATFLPNFFQRRNRMNKTIGVILGTAVVLLLVVPVLVAQLRQPESREWEGVNLSEMEYEEVQFYNEAQQIQLAGMLFVPEGSGPFPAVVFVHGSAPSFRGNRVILTVVKHLLDNGVIVLVPDKRGADASEGDWETASFADLATDTVTAVDYLLSVNRVKTPAF